MNRLANVWEGPEIVIVLNNKPGPEPEATGGAFLEGSIKMNKGII